jgi:TPP-dependent 2-oxoacid decarboxylase
MEKTSKINLLLFFSTSFLFLGLLNANSQTVHYDSVQKQKYVLIDVHKTYERITDKGYESVEMFEYLGNYYFDCNNLKKSKLYFDKLFEKYNLSQISQKSIERYKKIKL